MNKLLGSLLAGAFISASSVSGFLPTYNKYDVSRFRVSRTYKSEDSITDTDNPAGELLPEYQAALLKATGTVSEFLKDSKPELIPSLTHFCKEYMTANQNSSLKKGNENNTPMASFKRIIDGVQLAAMNGLGPNKFKFDAVHKALRGDPENENGNTVDYYAMGCDFFRPLMDPDASLVLGKEMLDQAVAQAAAGDNVIFFANHQSEADPQVVSVMLENSGYIQQGEDMYYVAGHKVTTDAIAIPFSMGRNLICIHSKKHINADPETKSIKSLQNVHAMNGMLGKLKEGGTMLWVAPSGGRDRRDLESGKTPIAPFDSKTIDLFRLMGNKSKRPTHYYTLAIVSYELCPPPDSVEAGVGEVRNFNFVPVGIKVGKELISEGGLGSRQAFCGAAFEQTKEDYFELREKIFPGTAPELD